MSEYGIYTANGYPMIIEAFNETTNRIDRLERFTSRELAEEAIITMIEDGIELPQDLEVREVINS